MPLMFLKSIIIGLSIAMPVGPIGMLCIKNTLSYGFKIGLAVGIGAAVADSFYGFLAGGGLELVSKILLDYSKIIKVFGSIILLYLGIIDIKNASNIPAIKANIKTKKFYKTIITVFFLTLTSPMTILTFIGIFAVIGGGVKLAISEIIAMVFGVFLGSLIWWIILSGTISIIRHKISNKFVVAVKVISGLILCGFGVWGLL